ncbi:hypothetical protein D3C79_336930 [compost metagenome]
MASEYFLYIQLGKLLADSRNYFWSVKKYESYSGEHLKALTRHHNGHIRQRAVLCLGLIRDVSALPHIIKRINDWAEPVRKSAKQSVERLLIDINADYFVECLPDIFWLLECQRVDHREFVDSIIKFLSHSKNKKALFTGLSFNDKLVAKHSLDLLVNNSLFPIGVVFTETMSNCNPIIRMHATKYQLKEMGVGNRYVIEIMLGDRFAPIKQLALQYMIDQNIILTEELAFKLLVDKNALVRSRAYRLLPEKEFNIIEFYLDILNDAASCAVKRKIALCGLSEHKYERVVELCERSLDSLSPGIYICSLKIIVQHRGEDARDILLDAMANSCICIVKSALSLIKKEKIHVKNSDAQGFLDILPSPSNLSVYYSLASLLNKWDWLLFIVRNEVAGGAEFTKLQIAYWGECYNRSSIPPTEFQREQLKIFINNIEESFIVDKVNFFILE